MLADTSSLANRLHAALPQTQCTRCGYPDCAAYAEAMASNSAAINQCPPGGAEGAARLAAIMGQPAVALNPANGLETPRSVAIIDETWCIGCTLCLPVCPTDAIFGTHKAMHTVIEPHCTGCGLCLPACPVDCIRLENVSGSATGWQAWSQPEAKRALERYEFHSIKGMKNAGFSPKTPSKSVKTTAAAAPSQSADLTDPKRAMIAAALAKARAQRGP
ncbi:MAG: RnfABCDGE type electron transport complex subunit B [Chitinophagaceae bacterium]|nr:RnfABCDGE type electron transport complex subunit B [Polaromonas sp.]